MSVRKKVGLALGAGSSRGIAHLGVLQVFEEEGIPIDVVTGCSMGAVIGALYATGSDMYFLEKYAETFNTVKFFDFSVHTGGLMKGKKIQQLIRLLTKNKKIEDTDIPFACSAIDIINSKLDVFQKGPIHQAVRASISIPGIFAPYDYNGTTYVDGSVLDRVPVQSARDLGADVVIAVDVAFRGAQRKKPGNALETLKATLELCDWNNANRILQDADVLLVPQIGEINPYSLKETPFIVKKGREAAKQALPQIRELLQEGL